MTIGQRPGRIVLAIAMLAAAVAVAGCGSGSSTSVSSSAASTGESTQASTEPAKGTSTELLGAPHKATGSPYIFGMINEESGPVTFPQVSAAAKASIDYVNEYKGGIDGHPIKLELCSTDGQPATSASCANQIAAKHPLLILAGADEAASGAFPVWERADLAYVGGVGFTPTDNESPRSVLFVGFQQVSNGASIKYFSTQKHVKKASLIYVDVPAGKYTAEGIENEMAHAGISLQTISVSPTQADLSSAAASAITSSPELVYLDLAGQCPAGLKALQGIGYTGLLGGLDLCASEAAIASAGEAADGFTFAESVESLDAEAKDAELASAILAKYAPDVTEIDAPALAALGSVINIQETLSKVATPLTTKKILAAFKSGSDHPNFLAHPYTCTGKIPGQSAVCNPYQLIKQINGGKVTTIASWIDGSSLYVPPTN
jgi:branched-chain amino acid transport system substrate-binding protein